MVYSITTVYGGNEYGKSGHLSIWNSFKHLILNAFIKTAIFIRAYFYTLSKTLIALCRDMQLRFVLKRKR